jgi:hypothetical protein
MSNKILFPPFLAKPDRYFATNHPVLYLSKLHYWLYYLLWAVLAIGLFSVAYTPQELPDEDLVLLVGNGAVGVGLLFWLRYEFWISPERRFPLPSARQATLLFGLRWLCLALAFCLPYLFLWKMGYEYRFSFTEVFNWAFLGSVFIYAAKFISWKQLTFLVPFTLVVQVLLWEYAYYAYAYVLYVLLSALFFYVLHSKQSWLQQRSLQLLVAKFLILALPSFTFFLLKNSYFLQKFIFDKIYLTLLLSRTRCCGCRENNFVVDVEDGLLLSFFTYFFTFLPLLHKYFMRLRSKPA